MNMKRLFKVRPILLPVSVLFLSFALYAVHVKFLLIPAMLWCVVRYVPFPRIFRSVLARTVVGFLIVTGVVLVGALLQFAFFRHTGFRMLALLATLTAMLFVVWGARVKSDKSSPTVWFDKQDAAAVAVVAVFAIPVILLTGLWHGGSVLNIAKFGGIQSGDGSNHFVMTTELSKDQHLDYGLRTYYPKGFHIDVAFIQDSFYANQSMLRYGLNVRLFIVQYLFYGALLAYLLYYLCRMAADMLGERLAGKAHGWLAATLAVPLGFFYLLPFMYQGFINFYYVLALFAVGLMYLKEFYEHRQAHGADSGHWLLLNYLLFTFCIGMSWPLLLPLLMIIPALYLLPDNAAWRDIPGWVRSALRPAYWPLLAAFALQLLPLYMQLKYTQINGGQQFNTPGSVRAFHFGVFVLGLAVLAYTALARNIPEVWRRFTYNTFLPLYVFMLALIAFQYFSAGEIRYYSIKSGYLLELVVLAMVAALAVHACSNVRMPRLQRAALPVIVVGVGFMLLIGMNVNPLQEVREMFRSLSGFGKPAFYDGDTLHVVNVNSGTGNYGDNVATLHYDRLSDKINGDLMISNWSMVMTHDATTTTPGRNCNSSLFIVDMYQDVSKGQQDDLKAQLRKCIAIARENHKPYYLVTDTDSVSYFRQLLGDGVVILH